MPLESTKLILQRLIKKYGKDLEYTRLDIKPQYGNYDGKGYPYKDFEDNDRDFIYNSIGELLHIVNNSDEAIQFDIENVFITEQKAVRALERTKKHIENNLAELHEIRKKYSNTYHYPIEVSISRYEEISSILQSIFDSQEMKEFKSPDLISQLKNENFDLKFEEYWRKRKWKCRIHFLLFIPFITGVCYAFLNKEDTSLNTFNKSTIVIICSLFTVVFNYLFNNHNSFKDAWKLLFEDTREELKQQEKGKFKI